MSVLFGPAGNGDAFVKAGYKRSAQAPAYLAGIGLDAYEYQCGRGVHIGEASAREIGAEAAAHGIKVSVHAPYFINLSSADPERRAKNTHYILESCRAASWLGAERVVVHCGGLSGLTRQEAGANTVAGLAAALYETEEAGFGEIRLCVETMGRVSVYGDLEEVCALCADRERLIPCVDFGHVNARTNGALSSEEDFKKLFDTMENLVGTDKARIFHGHFSKIEYSKGGEARHLTFEDTRYGPEFAYAAEIMAERGYRGTMICESAGSQAEDAVTMKRIYRECLKRNARGEKA